MNYDKISRISYRIQRITDVINKIIYYKENSNTIYNLWDTISMSDIEGFEDDVIKILKKKIVNLKEELDKELDLWQDMKNFNK